MNTYSQGKLSLDIWGDTSLPSSVVNPAWKQIEDALDAMDGEIIDAVYYGTDEENYVCAGGGNEHCYVCFVEEIDGRGIHVSYAINDGTKGKEEVILQVGGQAVIFRSNITCDLTVVKRVFEYYFSYHQRDPSFDWIVY